MFDWACQLCFCDQYERFEEDAQGDFWTYCAKCDVWTSHPPTNIGRSPRNPLQLSDGTRYPRKQAHFPK